MFDNPTFKLVQNCWLLDELCSQYLLIFPHATTTWKIISLLKKNNLIIYPCCHFRPDLRHWHIETDKLRYCWIHFVVIRQLLIQDLIWPIQSIGIMPFFLLGLSPCTFNLLSSFLNGVWMNLSKLFLFFYFY